MITLISWTFAALISLRLWHGCNLLYKNFKARKHQWTESYRRHLAPSRGYNQLTQGVDCFWPCFIFFSTVLLKVSFNMFNWEMDFFSAEVNRQSSYRSSCQGYHNYNAEIFKRKKKDKLELDLETYGATIPRIVCKAFPLFFLIHLISMFILCETNLNYL